MYTINNSFPCLGFVLCVIVLLDPLLSCGILSAVQEEHDISDRLLHNIAQEATWDASAR